MTIFGKLVPIPSFILHSGHITVSAEILIIEPVYWPLFNWLATKTFDDVTRFVIMSKYIKTYILSEYSYHIQDRFFRNSSIFTMRLSHKYTGEDSNAPSAILCARSGLLIILLIPSAKELTSSGLTRTAFSPSRNSSIVDSIAVAIIGLP